MIIGSCDHFYIGKQYVKLTLQSIRIILKDSLKQKTPKNTIKYHNKENVTNCER